MVDGTENLLAGALDRFNEQWVSAATFFSPQLLIGLLYNEQGDKLAAKAQFDGIRRGFFGQPEALAATIFHADLVRPESPREAVALYKRALSQLAGDEVAYNNLWLPVDEFRSRLAAAIDDLANRSNFAEALDLAEALVAPFSPVAAEGVASSSSFRNCATLAFQVGFSLMNV